MEKPDDILLKLVDLGRIRAIYVDQWKTGPDTTETYVKLIGSNGLETCLWSTVRDYLHVSVGHDSIAEVHRDDHIKVKEWREFEQATRDEYAEYQRLKAKFES